MLTLFMTLGILLFAISLIMMFVRPSLNDKDKLYPTNEADPNYDRYRVGEKISIASPKYLLWWSFRKSIIGAVIGLFLIVSHGLLFNVPMGYSASLQYMNGKQKGVTTPGYHLRWFASIHLWKNFFTVKYVTMEGENRDESEASYTGIRPAIGILFNDAVQASVTMSARGKLPSDPDKFLKLAIQFRTQENLINSTILPTIKNIVENTAYLFSAQEYIAGRAGEMKQDIFYQLQRGNYVLERKKYEDIKGYNIIDNTDRKSPAERKEIVRYISQKTFYKTGDKKGLPIVRQNSIQSNNIEIIQAPIEKILMEEKFRDLLKKQRDQAANANLAKQKAQTAEFEKQFVIAKGEKEKAEIKVGKEKEQIAVLIAIETQTKKAEEQVKRERMALEANKLAAQSIKVLADADAYANARLVSAGLSPQERARIDKEIAIGVAEKISALKLPEVYIGNGSKGGQNGILGDLLGAEFAKKMLNQK